MLDSLKDLQSNKNVNKTFKTWKKRQDDIRANYMPNVIEYIKDLERTVRSSYEYRNILKI